MTGNIFTINHKRDFDFNKIFHIFYVYTIKSSKLSKLIEKRDYLDNRNI